MSLAARLGLTDAALTALLLAALVLTLAPYIPGVTIGSLAVPRLDARKRRRLRIVGPIVLLSVLALALPLPIFRPPATHLRLIAADVTSAGEIDLAIENSGTSAALLTAVELEVTADRGIASRPALPSSATYRVPIDDLRVGGRNRLAIRHLISPGTIERILIAPSTARSLVVQVHVLAAEGPALQTTAELPPSR